MLWSNYWISRFSFWVGSIIAGINTTTNSLEEDMPLPEGIGRLRSRREWLQYSTLKPKLYIKLKFGQNKSKFFFNMRGWLLMIQKTKKEFSSLCERSLLDKRTNNGNLLSLQPSSLIWNYDYMHTIIDTNSELSISFGIHMSHEEASMEVFRSCGVEQSS